MSGWIVLVITLLLPYILLTGVLIWASIIAYRKGKLLLAFVFISPLVAYIAYHFTIEAKKADESKQVVKFVKSNKNILQITHGSATFGRPDASKMPRSPFPFKYEVSVAIEENAELPEIHVIIDASRTWTFGNPSFSITCITTKRFTERDANKSACEQKGVIQIPTKIQSSLKMQFPV